MAAALDQPPVRPASLDRVARAYAKVQGYQLAAVVTNRIIGNATKIPVPGPQQETLTVAYRAPNQWRFRSSTSNLAYLFRDRREYFIHMGGDSGSSLSSEMPDNDPKRRASQFAQFGVADYTAIKDDLKSARVLRQQDVVVGDLRIPCSVIEATYSTHIRDWDAAHWKRGSDTDYWVKQRTLWVDTSRDVVLREVDLIVSQGLVPDAKLKRPVGAAFERTIRVQEVQWNQLPPDGLFEVPPPAGTVLPDGTVTPLPNGRAPLVPIVDACQNIADQWSRWVCLHSAQTKLCSHLPITAEVRAARLAGPVTIAYTVNPDGVPDNISVKKGIGLGLDGEVAECIAKWRYRSPQKDGANPNVTVTFGNVGASSRDSFWHLSHVEFYPPNGATRPIFRETKYPPSQPNERILGFFLFHLQLTIGKDGIPRDVQVIPAVDPKLDKVAIQIVSSWRFRPGDEDGLPVDVPARFELGLGYNDQPGRAR